MGIYSTTTTLQIAMIGSSFDTATTLLAADMITDAESEVNKYLSQRYDIGSSPFDTSTTIPPIVKSCTKWLAMGYTYEQLSRGGDTNPRAQRLIDRAIDNLKMISEFKLNVLDSAGSVVADSSSSNFRVQCNTTDYSNTFNEDDELHWSVDSDKLDDIDSGRD
jgi:hypothetical protein